MNAQEKVGSGVVGFKTLGAAFLALTVSLSVNVTPLKAQDVLPDDNGLDVYHKQPRWRESESHPLRVLAYIVHPIGWVAREFVFRPLSFFASSTDASKSIMGYREPYDYRQPECFSSKDDTPDCKTVAPFNYSNGARSGFRDNGFEEKSSDTTASLGSTSGDSKEVFFPNVNFDFNKKTLSSVGKDHAKKLYGKLTSADYKSVNVVLEGHTDYLGSDDYNQKLGLDRAEAVKKYLVELGLSAERLSTVSFGKSRPISEEKTSLARSANRRVEVRLNHDK